MAADRVEEQVAERLYDIAIASLLPLNPRSEWSSWAKLGENHKMEFRKQAAGAIQLLREILLKAIDE